MGADKFQKPTYSLTIYETNRFEVETKSHNKVPHCIRYFVEQKISN